MKKYWLYSLILLMGCLSIRTPYVPVNYYYLNQEPFSFRNIAELETYIAYKEFTVPEELFDNRFMIWFDDGTVQKFSYHRFNADYSEIINSFIFIRLNQSKAFKFGVNQLNSSIVPNYIIEGSILEFKSYAEKEDKKKNWVQVSILVNLVKYKPLTTKKEIVFSKTYAQKFDISERENSKFVEGYSKLLSLLIDKVIFDIQSAIVHNVEQ